MHIFTLAVPTCAVSHHMLLIDSFPFLTVPRHTKFNLPYAVSVSSDWDGGVEMHTS